ncbi:FadR/GntR family transcriptional regulator [Alicyclobacillus mengziensis]|uniref:FadR family transcriptional regulator n=1 Tax=Alicyclobacillus mengziensis TaxID=2931921 RepID=A0A9X7W026_9BACL|nr:GntR family transcriptional regulator [Alicyclobacillus mengziensis]QSO48201.1 FadR family transcriptional regulator [Alicyclobacillus mengziensis]
MTQYTATSQKLYVQIAKAIRERIEDGAYLPGDRLPPLAKLAEEYNCSRATVREALGTLRGQGLIEFRQGDGTYVRTASLDLWMEPLDAALLLGVSHIRELVELQIAVLAAVASRLADHEGPKDALAQNLFQLECAVSNSEEAITAEINFYLKMADYAGNPLLENVVRVMQESFRSCLRLVSGGEPLGLETCRAVFDAITQHKADFAREIMYTYGRSIMRRLELERTGKLHAVAIPFLMDDGTSGD